MKRTQLSSFLLICFPLLAIALLAPPAHGQMFEELANRVPDSANAIVFVNTEKILESPAAVKGEWKSKARAAHRSGLTLLPPYSKRAIFAAELDLDFGAPIWQVMLATWKNVPAVETIIKKTKGTSDNIGGLAAVRLPQDAYVLRSTNDIIAFMAPANRQLVSRWVRDDKRPNGPILSNYLTEAYEYSNSVGTPLVMAVDLHDVVTEKGVRAKLQDRWTEYEFEAKAKLNDVAPVLTSIHGVTLGVTFNEEAHGALKVDFGQDVAPLAPIAKELLLAVLHERGIFINEFEDWKLTAKGQQIRLDGKLTRSGLRRLLSVFDPPPAMLEAEPEQPAAPKDEKQQMAEKSLEYFHTLQELFKDLKNEPNRQGNHYTIGSIMGWYERYSRQIDNLPILGVDPGLVEFGANMADGLRQASYAIKTGGVAAKTATMNNAGQATSYRVAWNNYGYAAWGVNNAADQQAQDSRIRTEYRNKSIFSARQIVDGIDASLLDLRRQLTLKYQVEF